MNTKPNGLVLIEFKTPEEAAEFEKRLIKFKNSNGANLHSGLLNSIVGKAIEIKDASSFMSDFGY